MIHPNQNDAFSTSAPLSAKLHQAVAAARSVAELRALGPQILDLARIASRPGTDLKRHVQRIAGLNDAVSRRLIALLEATEGIRLPEGAAYLVFGSEGRGEQTLRTDQDSAVVYTDHLPPNQLGDVERFAVRFVEALEAIGVPRCPGNIMASNPRWRHRLSSWKHLLDQWLAVPTPAHILDFGIFLGLRTIHGNRTLEKQLQDHIRAAIRHPSLFYPHMARHALRFPLPLTPFGRIRVERSGEHKGQVDVKKAGIFAMTAGTSLLALEAGVLGGTTWEKLELLGKRGILAPGDLEPMADAFTFLVRLRLRRQLLELDAKAPITNHVDPRDMTDDERRQFRQALKGVKSFLRTLNNRYQLNFISR